MEDSDCILLANQNQLKRPVLHVAENEQLSSGTSD